MELHTLSHENLIASLRDLRGTERETTLSILYHLIELERRDLHLISGYSSLYDYCRRALGYSESSAYRRVAGARALRDNPEIAELLLEGKVTLCSLATAAKCIAERKTTVQEIVGKSKQEVKLLVAHHQPTHHKPKEVVKPVIVEHPPLAVCPPEERYRIAFSVSKEVYEQFERAQSMLSHKLGAAPSVERTFERLLESFLKPKERRVKKLNNTSRYVPRSVKREIWERDQGRCTYVAPDGTKCCETKFLELDHIRPFALGGKTAVENLRLACRSHNQLAAKAVFSPCDLHR